MASPSASMVVGISIGMAIFAVILLTAVHRLFFASTAPRDEPVERNPNRDRSDEQLERMHEVIRLNNLYAWERLCENTDKLRGSLSTKTAAGKGVVGSRYPDKPEFGRILKIVNGPVDDSSSSSGKTFPQIAIVPPPPPSPRRDPVHLRPPGAPRARPDPYGGPKQMARGSRIIEEWEKQNGQFSDFSRNSEK